jgi:hypothetical protein
MGGIMICNNNLCSGVDKYFLPHKIKHQRHFTVTAVKDRNFVSEQDKNPQEGEALKTNQNKHSELNQTFISSYTHVFFKDNSI